MSEPKHIVNRPIKTSKEASGSARVGAAKMFSSFDSALFECPAFFLCQWTSVIVFGDHRHAPCHLRWCSTTCEIPSHERFAFPMVCSINVLMIVSKGSIFERI